MTKAEALAILGLVVQAITDTINESPDGAPSGSLYLACQMHGMSLETYQQIMLGLVKAGKVRRQGHLYFKAS